MIAPKNNEKAMVVPTDEYHSAVKSSKLPLRIGKPFGTFQESILALIKSKTIPVFTNWTIHILDELEASCSVIVWALSYLLTKRKKILKTPLRTVMKTEIPYIIVNEKVYEVSQLLHGLSPLANSKSATANLMFVNC